MVVFSTASSKVGISQGKPVVSQRHFSGSAASKQFGNEIVINKTDGRREVRGAHRSFSMEYPWTHTNGI